MLAMGTFIPGTINATHIVGGDISYECLGNDFYEVTLTLRRDCINGAEDAPFDELAAVGIFDKTGKKLDFIGRLGILYLPFNGADTIKNNIPECALDGDLICVAEAVYVGQIHLPFRERGYVLTYQRCCRNGTLNNIINPLETGATRTVSISRESQLECNSGPAFGAFPDIIACANEEFSVDASATDPDGDVLTYSLVTPYSGASIDYPKPQPPWNPPYNGYVQFSDGFSVDNMLGSGTALTIDENTGMLTAVPSAIGQYLVGVMVEEWRDGEKVGETIRDFEVNVRVCQSFPDVTFEAEDNCAGLTVDVTNNTTGAVSYVWDFNHPSGDPAFMSTEENPGSFTYPEPGVYNIRLEATDSEGRCILDDIKEIRAYNSQLTSDYTFSNGCCVDGETELSLVATSLEPSADFEIASYDYIVTINGETPFNLSEANNRFTVQCSDNVEVTLVTTSSSGCRASETKTISIEQDFGSIEGNICMEELTICLGGSGSVGPLNDTRTYEWTPTDATIDLSDPFNPVFLPSDSTIYTVIATDENGAQSTGSVAVNVLGTFDLSIMDVSDIECDSAVTFTALTNREDLSYQWSTTDDFANVISTENPASIEMMAGANTIYVKAILSVDDGSGNIIECEEVSLLLVESKVLDLQANVNVYNACEEEFTIVSLENLATDQDVSIIWDASDNIVSDDLNSTSINVAALSTEQVISLSYSASNGDGCEITGTVDVPVTRSISASVTGDTISCDGNFNLLANSNSAGATFEWSLSSDFSEVIGTDPNIALTLTENGTIYMRASVGEVCVSEIVATPLSLGAFEVDFGTLPPEICIGDELIITGTSADPTVVITYGPSENILVDNGNNMVTIGVISGQSEVTIPYSATNAAGCDIMDTIRIPVGTTDQPTITVLNIDCFTGEVMFKSGRPDGTVTWDFGDGGSSTDGDPTYTYASGGTYTVELSSNAEFCKFETVTLMPDLIVPELNDLKPIGETDVKYCDNEPITLGVMLTGNATIAWEDNNGNSLGSGPEITIAPNGEYDTVKVIATPEDPLCGMSMIEFSLSRYVFDITRGDIPEIVCPGEDFNLSVTDNTGSELTYQWMPASAVVSGGDTPNPTLLVDSDTDIVVRITNEEFMCSHEEVFIIDVPELDLTVNADPEADIFLCDEVVIFVDPGNFSTYEWSNGATGPTQSVEPTETTTYTVTITDTNGCTNTGSVTINVEVPPCSEIGIFVPNAFSPNNDGNNDLLLVRSNAVKEMDFFITDRWGNQVFRTTNQRDGWNGKYNNDGRELSSDVYAWCLIAKCSDGNDIHLVGNVSLLR